MSAGRLDIKSLIGWSYVVPVGSVWAIVSFLPVVGLFEKGASSVALLGEFFFLASGLVGIAGIVFALRMLVAPQRRSELPNPLKGKPISIAIYTTLWLASYAAFQYFS